MLLLKRLLLFSLILASCSKESFLSGEDKTILFAEPSAMEISRVWQDWKARNLVPTDYKVEQEAVLFSGNFTFKMVSFRLNGIKEYGALLIPKTAQKVPVRLLIGGFGLDVTTNAFNLMSDSTAGASSYILAIPALRGQSLQLGLNGTTYTSPLSEGNHCDAFDGATDDVLAFLNVIAATEPNADVDRTAVRGGSRGGTVALLAGIRDSRVKRVVAIAGPTNMLELTSGNSDDPTYRCQFLSGFKSGQLSAAQTRTLLIASSPLYFADHLPATQLHMGLRDWQVPVAQGSALQEKMTGHSGDFQFYIYDRTHEDIARSNPALEERVTAFLKQL